MVSNKTQRWKNLERSTAKTFTKFGIPAKRISRSGNYSVSTFDVEVDGHPEFKIDSKYRQSGFLTHRLLEEIQLKYCKSYDDIPILVTKGYKQTGSDTIVDSDYFAMLLAFWLGVADKETLWGIYRGKIDPFNAKEE
jgi:hypothetical protein